MKLKSFVKVTSSAAALASAVVVGFVGAAAAAAAAGAPAANYASSIAGKPVDELRGISVEEAEAVFSEEQKSFPYVLPSGVEWPQNLPAHLMVDELRMDENVPRAIASFFWLCSWENEYIATGGSAKAQSMVETFENLPFFETQFVDPEQAWKQRVLQPALRGDSSGLVADYASCGYFEESIANQ